MELKQKIRAAKKNAASITRDYITFDFTNHADMLKFRGIRKQVPLVDILAFIVAYAAKKTKQCESGKNPLREISRGFLLPKSVA